MRSPTAAPLFRYLALRLGLLLMVRYAWVGTGVIPPGLETIHVGVDWQLERRRAGPGRGGRPV